MRVTKPDGTVIEYINDPLGRRIAKKINGILVEKYLWQGLTRLLAIYDTSDNILMRFQYADSRLPVAMTSGGNTFYLSYDQVGSLRMVTDATGSVIKALDYDSFGNIIEDTNPSFDMPFGFAGGLYDPDIGLVRFGFREYSPEIGRWTAKDPILFLGRSVDLYGYCLNDPVNLIDPFGLKFSSGFDANVSTVAGKGYIAGYNYQNNENYYYTGEGYGLDLGATAQSVWAWGSGEWTGDFSSIVGGWGWISGSVFWSPGEGGWFGFTFGLSAGIPLTGAYEKTNYSRNPKVLLPSWLRSKPKPKPCP